MHKIKVNDKFDFEAERQGDALLVNNSFVTPDIKELRPGLYHIVNGTASYNAEVISFDKEAKAAVVKVNNTVYTLSGKDRFDMLLEKMGLSNMAAKSVSEIKAPMPGLVLKVFVEPGADVKKGENLFVLEAMKMENIIKAPADVNIKVIKIKPGDKVEKGQILMSF
ncbi:acetyl-CoA carboxylase biotin carboxyl carrier protein subunit [Mucilaginibacter pedocola]|uniref:Acetyl-CoA carboxylase biotin carboxyl carrier protein subunit n=1 Tax=Mucilaginibacter pedocola TaxID=1792845 RepID=A0A1S9P9R6_9SPHI|nr:acetyl-CoA carboxylase biotin carboxyl carrier protein subunit [Mucilaginibacter pedocola]OOQ57691.1 acetyl-CoA carboxylase biotin carboxyl carrier protein subunit [Mucilaginibacter pedocola]